MVAEMAHDWAEKSAGAMAASSVEEMVA